MYPATLTTIAELGYPVTASPVATPSATFVDEFVSVPQFI